MRFVVEMRALALFVFASTASGQSADRGKGLIGAVECAACHRGEFEAQSRSEHAHALSRPAEHALAGAFASSSDIVRLARYRFHFFSVDGAFHVRAWDNADEIEIPLDWAFGAGEQAVTFVSKIDSEWYLENALSYYSASRSYALTPGQQDASEGSLKTAVGRMYRSDDTVAGITGCFECHSTGPVTRDASGALRPHEMGVRCEACHGEGAAHKSAALSRNRKQTTSSIANPGRMAAQELNMFCGKCHRASGPAGVDTDWNVAWNVRHEPIYFSQSACFRQSHDAFSCITCHDPHAALVRSDRFYNAKCRECHNETTRRPAKACGERDTANCVECHMPKVSPQPWLRFTNHWIGIYGEGGKLKPLR